MIIYRGYTIEQTKDGWVIRKDERFVFQAKSESAAYLWIDGKKAAK